ncbi:MAG: hypothetical protein AB1638_04670 [Nitrospirota bacterium]
MKIRVPIADAVELGSWFEAYAWTPDLDIYNFRFKILSCEEINLYENFSKKVWPEKLILLRLTLSVVNLYKKGVSLNNILKAILISDKSGLEVSYDRFYFEESNLNPEIKYTGLVEYILSRYDLTQYCVTFFGDAQKKGQAGF